MPRPPGPPAPRIASIIFAPGFSLNSLLSFQVPLSWGGAVCGSLAAASEALSAPAIPKRRMNSVLVCIM